MNLDILGFKVAMLADMLFHFALQPPDADRNRDADEQYETNDDRDKYRTQKYGDGEYGQPDNRSDHPAQKTLGKCPGTLVTKL